MALTEMALGDRVRLLSSYIKFKKIKETYVFYQRCRRQYINQLKVVAVDRLGRNQSRNGSPNEKESITLCTVQ